jgi:hypothetical protein
MWPDDGLQSFQQRIVGERDPAAQGHAVKGKEPPKRCGHISAQSHRKDAREVVRNTIKHASAEKVAVTAEEGVEACARPLAGDFLQIRDICFSRFVHLTG